MFIGLPKAPMEYVSLEGFERRHLSGLTFLGAARPGAWFSTPSFLPPWDRDKSVFLGQYVFLAVEDS